MGKAVSVRLSVAEQLARKRALVEQLRRETYSAEEVVNAYARAFYGSISSELLNSQREFERARAEGIHPRHAALLYEVAFDDIEDFIYNWLEANSTAAMQVAACTVGLPSLTYSLEREIAYGENHLKHVKKIQAIVKRLGGTPYDIGQFAKVIEMIYGLLEVFNHSHQLSRREQETMPANLALISVELKDELACLKLPSLAHNVSYGDVREGASTQHTGEVRYPKRLWADELTNF